MYLKKKKDQKNSPNEQIKYKSKQTKQDDDQIDTLKSSNDSNKKRSKFDLK